MKEAHALEKEVWAAEKEKLNEKIASLELEWNLSFARYDTLLKEHLKLEEMYNQTVAAAAQTEQTYKDTLSFFQHSLAKANNINVQACSQMSAYKQKAELLEAKIAQAVALSQAQQQNMSRVPLPPQTQAIAQAQAQAELMKRVGAMLQAYGQGTGGVSEQGVPNQKPSLNPTAPEYQPK